MKNLTLNVTLSKLLALTLIVLAAGPAQADSLFNQEAAKSGTLVSQKVSRFEIGDIITVLIRENLDADTRAETNTEKSGEVDLQTPLAQNQFLAGNKPNGINVLNPGELPNLNIEAENKTENDGRTRRRNTLTTSISCFVKEVLPNGNVVVQGEKQVTVNREDSTIRVTGVIRSRDVTPENTVQSTQMANAQVMVKGKGPLWNTQRRGFVTKFLDWFSPF